MAVDEEFKTEVYNDHLLQEAATTGALMILAYVIMVRIGFIKGGITYFGRVIFGEDVIFTGIGFG